MTTVHVVLEFVPDDLPTGLARRHDHLLAAFGDGDDADGEGAVAVRTAIVNRAPRKSMAVRARLAAARRFAAAWPGDRSEPIVVVGLGTPTMLVLAAALARRGFRTAFDASDSAVIQLRERLRTRDPRLVTVALAVLALQATAPRRLGVLYVAERDRLVDARFNRRRHTAVVGPTAHPALGGLPPVRHPLTRIVVPADLASFHVQAGYRMLVAALELHDVEVDGPALPIEVYGPVPPTERGIAAGLVPRGWTPRLTEVYAGDSAVLVLNVGGSGVPNKVVEALAGGRPLVVHESVARQLGLHDVVVFTDAASLATALREVRTADGPPARADGDPSAAGGRAALADLLVP